MVLLFSLLTYDGMDDRLQDILLGHNTLHIFNEVISIISLVIFQIINNQIQSCLWNDINKRWKHLKSVLSLSKHNEIMSKQVVILNDISRRARISQ